MAVDDRDGDGSEGVVVFHVGGNITGVWNDFTEFADADQDYFANLVDEDLVEPVETADGTGLRPGTTDETPLPTITAQTGVQLEDLVLLEGDAAIAKALQIRLIAEEGVFGV